MREGGQVGLFGGVREPGVRFRKGLGLSAAVIGFRIFRCRQG